MSAQFSPFSLFADSQTALSELIAVPETLPYDRLISAMESPVRPTITVVGDYCLDKYLFIDAALDEPSVETGLTAYQVRRVESYAGVGGTITANLVALDADVHCVGLYGRDGEGFELIAALNSLGAYTAGMACSRKMRTNTYIKPMRMNDEQWTELNRLDIRNDHSAPFEMLSQTRQSFDLALRQSGAVIITDQFITEAGSILDEDFRSFIARRAEECEQVFFLADSRAHIENYNGVMIKCNISEMAQAITRLGNPDGLTLPASAPYDLASVLAAGQFFVRINGKPVLITLSENGSILIEPDSRPMYIPPVKVEGPIDICGAGDATNAAIAVGTQLGLTLFESALLANIVSSITIQQIGVTGTATRAQVLEYLKKASSER